MVDSITRIAFVTTTNSAFSRQLASGLSQFAKPSQGYVLREFFVGRDATELPSAFKSWSPDAIVGFIGSSEVGLLAELAASGLPMVNTARVVPLPGRGVVLGDADELYDAVHGHFRELGIREVVQFIMGESLTAYGTRERYQRYAEDRGLAFHSYDTADPEELDDFDRMTQVDETVANWLRGLPRPVGIFSQNTLAGGYLCRACELLGISAPDEVAVIGADGFDAALTSRPPLTTVHIPGEAIGYEAGKLAASMLRGAPAPKEIVRISGARLIVRSSTVGRVRNGCNVDAAMDFIFNHACEGIRVNDVVSHTQGVSRMTFHKRFTNAFGTTPGEALKERQLSEARRLLSETQLSLGTIAGMCGFCDYIHFYRVFREAEGVAPRDYRRAVFHA